MALIHDTVKSEFYAEEMEAYLDSLKSRIRKGRAHPLLETRRGYRAHIRENVRALGLKRIEKTLTLAELLAQGDDGDEDQGEGGDQQEPEPQGAT